MSEQLRDMELAGADLSGLNLRYADLRHVDLRGVNFARTNLFQANLTGADLNRANLEGADLSSAKLTYAHLCNANLSGAEMRHTGLWQADLTSAVLRNANAVCANLTDANLKHTDLAGANLTDAIIRGANFSGSTGLIDPCEWMTSNFEANEDGYLVYKVFGLIHKAPWKTITQGAVISESVNPDRTNQCACGINFATPTWLRANGGDRNATVWQCLIRWKWLPLVVVPYNTDGKARCGRVQLVKSMPLKQLLGE